MKEVFEFLKSNCIESKSLLRIAQRQLWFDFDNFQIIVEFTWKKECDFDDNFIPISELSFFSLENIAFEKLYIQILKNTIYEGEGIDLKYFHPCIWQMYNVVNQIKLNYPDAIQAFYAEPLCIDDCGWEFGCPEIWEYGFIIELKNEFWTNWDFFSFIFNKVNYNSIELKIPNFYKNAKIKDSFELKTLNSNTKIRRLGYLKIMLKMFNEQTKIPISKINSKFEKYCQNYNQFLDKYKNQKGNVVVTKTGYSAKPYIELAVNLGLIRKSAGIYEIGKIGKVYNILKDKIDKPDTNPFALSKFDTTFFLELLLKEDYWFLYAILEQTAINPNISFKTLKTEFKQILLGQIKEFIDEAQRENSKQVLPLKIRERGINDWKKPEIYMEHILMPRLNWLYDMNIIDLKNDLSFQLTEIGNRLLFNLAVWKDITLHQIVSPTAYIDNYFMKIMDYVLETQNQKYAKETDDKFTKCLEDSFVLFRTLAPNRITFSLFANYTKQLLFWNHSVIVDTENIKRAFELKHIPNYIYKYQEQYKDGYIQKINQNELF